MYIAAIDYKRYLIGKFCSKKLNEGKYTTCENTQHA
jgi:hypothetical protein